MTPIDYVGIVVHEDHYNWWMESDPSGKWRGEREFGMSRWGCVHRIEVEGDEVVNFHPPIPEVEIAIPRVRVGARHYWSRRYDDECSKMAKGMGRQPKSDWRDHPRRPRNQVVAG